MAKLIVTHLRPDLDACASVWLIRRFYPNFTQAEFSFVPSGDTYQNQLADSDKQIIHVDTGLGRFDHHQFRRRLSASLRIYQYLEEEVKWRTLDQIVLERMVELVTMIDNFEEVDFDNPTSDIYELQINQILEGIKLNESSDHQVMELMLPVLDGLFAILKRKVMAETELEKGEEFKIGQFKAIYLRSRSKEVSKLAEKGGYQLVLLKDPERGNVNIRVHPRAKFTLDHVYQVIIKKEPDDLWFYHASGHLLLNGSNSHPQKPTKLTVKELITIIKKNLLK